MNQCIGIFIGIFIILLGIYFLKSRCEYGSNQGINTPSARKSKENWDYTQRNAPKFMIQYGLLNVIINILIFLYSTWSHHVSTMIFVIEIVISLAVISAMIVHIELDIRNFERKHKN